MFFMVWIFTFVMVFVADLSEIDNSGGDSYLAAALVIAAIFWKDRR